MCVNASKLWNIANYERNEFKQLVFSEMPNWFNQKKIGINQHFITYIMLAYMYLNFYNKINV